MSVIKGFIEVTSGKDSKFSLNVSFIEDFEDRFIWMNSGHSFHINESYDQIKELIKQATEG